MTVRQMPLPPERWVGRKEMARLLDVSLSTLDVWVGEGMPSETWGMRTRKFLPSQALAWAHDRGQRKMAA